MGCKELLLEAVFHSSNNLAWVPARCQESCSFIQRSSLLFADFLTKTSLGDLHSIKLFDEGECRVEWEGMESWTPRDCVSPVGEHAGSRPKQFTLSWPAAGL